MSTDNFFIYYLAAIGNPDLDYKIKILKHNLCFIFNNIKKPYDIVINCYDDCTLLIETMLNSLSFIRNIFIFRIDYFNACCQFSQSSAKFGN